MTLSLSDLTAEKSLVPGSEDGKETLSGDEGLQVSLVVAGGAGGGGSTVKEKHHSLTPFYLKAYTTHIKAIVHSPPTLFCHNVGSCSFEAEAVVGDWNVEKPVALFLW